MATTRKLPAYALMFLALILLLIATDLNFSRGLHPFRTPKIHPRQLDNVQTPCILPFDPNSSHTTPFKQILIWNSPKRIESAAFGTGYEAFVNNKCRYRNCILLTNTSLVNLQEIDALLINMQDVIYVTLPEFQRLPFQRFVFFTQESPTTMPIDPSEYQHYFNWTMSYRRDSDIKLLYGRVTPKNSTTTSMNQPPLLKSTQTTNVATKKTKLVAWFASHCETASLRENYVRELEKYVPVDVYGDCGNLTCKRNDDHWLSYPECYDMLENTYKFYLSFENSLCVDYVTEKFFNILQLRVVPVVYGGANYSQIAPQHSYIDANVLSPKELASLLTTLDKNDTLYNEYFWWKEYYSVDTGNQWTSQHAFCDLCEKLYTDSETKVYETMATQWSGNQCFQPRETFD